MINNNLFTVFPIFDDMSKQNRFKEGCKDDVCTFRLYCPKERLLPFQFRRVPSAAVINSIKLICHDGIYFEDILADIPVGQLEYATAGGFDYITYYGTEDLDEDLPCGDYYLEITDEDGNTGGAEVCHVAEDAIIPDNYRISRTYIYREWDDNELRIYK